MTASLSRQALIEQTLAEHRFLASSVARPDRCLCGGWSWVGGVDAQPHRAHVAAVLAALDAPQGGDEARLTEGETAEILAGLGWKWEPSDEENIPSPEDCFDEAGGVIERILADRLAAPRDQAGDTLAERVRALADKWSGQHRDNARTFADELRALLADQPDATASEEDQR